MKLYADTSFLFSYYASDINSVRADSWRQSHPFPLTFSAVNRLELRNAIELAVFQSRLTVKEAVEIWLAVESDLTAGFLAPAEIVLADLLHEAEGLAAAHTAKIGTRSLDILHVALAQLLQVDEFVTFDHRQTTLANQIGLTVAKI